MGGFLVTARRMPSGRLAVDPCPSCGRRHVHRHPGTQHAPCGMTYEVMPVVPATTTSRRSA